MISRRLACCLALAVLAGCGADRGSGRPPSASQWTPARASHVQLQVQSLGDVANSGCQLPVVSPDGKWIAYLRNRAVGPIELEALFTGKGLDSTALYVQPVAPGAAPQLVCSAGAGWPAWSPDGGKLAFIAYGEAGRCDVGIHDLAAGTTRRVTGPFKRMMMPAISPDGKRLAVVVPGATLDRTRLHVLMPGGAPPVACPAESDQTQQLWPLWTPDGQILYLLRQRQRTWLARWRPGGSRPQRLWEISMMPSRMGMIQIFAGLGRPLSPDGGRLAYYDYANDRDRIVLLNLFDGEREDLPPGTRFGCWLGSGRFLAASDDEMILHTSSSAEAIRLVPGRWLPRWGAVEGGQFVVCEAGANPWTFKLLQMNLLRGG